MHRLLSRENKGTKCNKNQFSPCVLKRLGGALGGWRGEEGSEGNR